MNALTKQQICDFRLSFAWYTLCLFCYSPCYRHRLLPMNRQHEFFSLLAHIQRSAYLPHAAQSP